MKPQHEAERKADSDAPAPETSKRRAASGHYRLRSSPDELDLQPEIATIDFAHVSVMSGFAPAITGGLLEAGVLRRRAEPV